MFEIICEACGNNYSYKKIQNNEGNCPGCSGTLWTINMVIPVNVQGTETVNVLGSLLGLSMLAVSGVGFTVKDKALSKFREEHVPAHIMKQICPPNENWKEALYRFMMDRNAKSIRRDIERRGGQRCKRCNMVFIPKAENPWYEAGYCSHTCHALSDPVGVQKISSSEASISSNLMVAKCPNGHEFTVPRMFAGVIRLCPECQERVLIPSQ